MKNIKNALFGLIVIFTLNLQGGQQLFNGSENKLNDSALVFMYQYFINELLENQREVYLALGNYIDGEDLISPNSCVKREVQKRFPDRAVFSLPLRYIQEGAAFSGNGTVLSLEIIALGLGEKSPHMTAIVLVHIVRGPLDANGEAFQISFFDGSWHVTHLKRVYVS